MREIGDIRETMRAIINDGMRLPSLPQYLNGFILALNFSPRIALFVVEIMSELFAKLPDNILIPWLQSLILHMRKHQHILQPLIKEASNIFPKDLYSFDDWQPQWLIDVPQATPTASVGLSASEQTICTMLESEPATTNALAQHFGITDFTWQEIGQSAAALSENEQAIQSLLKSAPATSDALADLLD